MTHSYQISITSEIGDLEGVVLHRPGLEVENMTPATIKRALYSDILNLTVASREFARLDGVLNRMTQVFYVKDLLGDLLKDPQQKQHLLEEICQNEGTRDILDEMLPVDPEILAAQLIEGVVLTKDTLAKFLSKEYYALPPLHNFFFTRDSAFAIGDQIYIGKMAGRIRRRETLIMKAIYANHPKFRSHPVCAGNPLQAPDKRLVLEGGDVLVVENDIVLIGIGARTNAQGVDFLIEQLNRKKIAKHIIVQRLPSSPESFIHLDMVFTMVDKAQCVIYPPVILSDTRFETIHIALENGRVTSIDYKKNLLAALRDLGMDLVPIACGGNDDSWFQQREQWHSGANFFAMGPGKVIGYGGNIHTLEEMNRHGFEVLSAQEVLSKEIRLEDYKKIVVTIQGSELSRGGGGCRCMTQPIRRRPVDW